MRGGGVKATSRLNIIMTRLNIIIIFFLPTFPSTRIFDSKQAGEEAEHVPEMG